MRTRVVHARRHPPRVVHGQRVRVQGPHGRPMRPRIRLTPVAWVGIGVWAGLGAGLGIAAGDLASYVLGMIGIGAAIALAAEARDRG
jgi:hypothetical protein